MSRRTLSAIVLDLVILCVLVATFWRVFGGAGAFARKEAGPRPTIRVGMALNLPGVDWGQTHRNVVLALRTTCGACIASAPFYKELAATVSSASASLVVLSTDRAESIRGWLTANSVSAEHILPEIDLPALGFLVVPTLLVVSPAGTVTDVLPGVLTADEQRKVLEQLSGNRQPRDE